MNQTFRLAGMVRLAVLISLTGAIAHPLRSAACTSTSDCAFDSSLGCGTVTCSHSSWKCQFTGDPSIGQPCKTAAQQDGMTVCSIATSGGQTTMSLRCQPTLCAPGAQGQSWNACTTAEGALGTWACLVGTGTASYQWVCQADPSLCVPGKTECSGTGTHTCAADGTWGVATACPATAPQCVDGTCQCQCHDGDTRCNAAGTGQQTCSGCQWGPETACASGFCGGNECQTCPTCPTCPVCTDGTASCVSASVRRLCVNGQWTEQTCTGSCNAGQCTSAECVPACTLPFTCVGGQCKRLIQKCNPPCQAPYRCIAGSCVKPAGLCIPACKLPRTCINGKCVMLE